MLIRPAELEAIRRGEIDLAFRRWDRPRVRVGTRLRTAVGLLEVVSVDRVPLSALRAEDARRAGARSLSALKDALAAKSDRSIFRDKAAAVRQIVEKLPEDDEFIKAIGRATADRHRMLYRIGLVADRLRRAGVPVRLREGLGLPAAEPTEA